jgi:membrane protein required for colicin V production
MSLDLILGIVLVWGFYQGYAHGIIQTVFNFASYFFGLMIAFKMTPTTTNTLNQLFHTDNPLMFVAGFLVMFVLVMMAFRVAGRSLEGVFNFAHAGSVNHIAGGALLGAIYVLLFSILVWFANKANLIDESTKRTARSWPLLEALPPRAKVVAERVSPIVKDFWNSSINMVDRLDKYGVQKTESNQRVYDLPKPTPTGQNIFEPYPDRPKKEN